MSWVTAAASVAAARQASAVGKYNQAIQNRNAQVAEQEAQAIQQRTELDLARFDQQFAQLQSETKVSTLKSGVELSGTALKILRSNAEQAEVEKDIIEYNSKIGQARAFEQANFARMQGSLARQQGRAAAIGYYGQAASALAPYGKSLLSSQTQTTTDLTATEGSF
jgi:tetrahydromethanopterin S-methyltransferase subunit H